MHIEIEKVLNRRNLTQRLQLVAIALLLAVGLLTSLSMDRRLSLVEPKLPVGLERVTDCRQELIFNLHREQRVSFWTSFLSLFHCHFILPLLACHRLPLFSDLLVGLHVSI